MLHAVTAAVELALLEWAEGARRLAALELTARRRFVVEAVVDELDAEIVRRVGQSFDLARLTSVYASSEPWCLDVAQRVDRRDVGVRPVRRCSRPPSPGSPEARSTTAEVWATGAWRSRGGRRTGRRSSSQWAIDYR